MNPPRFELNADRSAYSRRFLSGAFKYRAVLRELDDQTRFSSPLVVDTTNSSPISIGSSPATVVGTPSPIEHKRNSSTFEQPASKRTKIPKKSSDFQDGGVFEATVQSAQRRYIREELAKKAATAKANEEAEAARAQLAQVAVDTNDLLLQAVCEDSILADAAEGFDAADGSAARADFDEFERLMDSFDAKEDDVTEPPFPLEPDALYKDD